MAHSSVPSLRSSPFIVNLKLTPLAGMTKSKKSSPEREEPSSRSAAKTVPAQKRRSDEREHIIQNVLVLMLLAISGYFLAHQIDLTTGDLGRHLKNGQIFVQDRLVPNTNLYSYTYPDYPFVNHHWASGVVFYLIERLLGFAGLSLAFIGLSMATLFIFLHIAIKYSSFFVAGPIALAVIPVLITRHEFRPETFSYFFCGLFLYILWGYKRRALHFSWLLLLPVFAVLWVNLHIYFFIGVVLVALLLFELALLSVLRKQPAMYSQAKGMAIVLVLTILATCVNPAGIWGALYPLFILREYEFPVIENYSIPAILSEGFQFHPLPYFFIVFALLCVSWLYAIIKQRASLSAGNFLLSLILSAMAWIAIRNFALFAYFTLPIAAVNLSGVQGSGQPGAGRGTRKLAASLGIISLALVLINPQFFVSSNRGRVGIALEADNRAAAEFVLTQSLQGPIFNNFDVAGYLIYHLFPEHRVFVDNRPEAYPGSFFRDVYFPLQIDEESWTRISEFYGFNLIFFNHRDRSFMGEQFIVRRVLDPLWAPVFVDKDVIILVRRYGPNQPTITKYELPKERILIRSQ